MKLKKLAVFALIAALLLPMLPTAQAAPADTVYVRKHVSLVYDNSGSMKQKLDNAQNLKWTYASYAAQIFAGLLNDKDSLTVTLMNENKNIKKLEVDLAADRQQQVDKLRDVTNYAKGETPFNSVTEAEKVLVQKGLLADAQIGDNAINKNEQYWLVLTTDGQFDNGNMGKAALEKKIEALLKKYSNLQFVYFGIGTEGDTSKEAAIDLRDSAVLKGYPNFTAVFAEKQEQIVSTMQTLANRISGRYSVTKGVEFNGTQVTLDISGETSPIRNIAILAQRTDTKLLSAVDENGRQLTVARPANEQFPQNSSYNNVPADTKGAHTALVTDPNGKFEPGKVMLTFSEPVDPADFSLMYEPAVYVSLKVEQKDAAGNWVEIPYGDKVQSGRPLRVSYEILEDGTNAPVDATKLPGVTTEHITCGDTVINKGGEFNAPSGNTNITATVSMMDGTYVVSTVRNLQVICLDDYSFQVSDALSFYPDELEANTNSYISFKVFYEGAPASPELMTDFTVDAGSLQGTLTTPGNGEFRFTPKQAGCAPGELSVSLCFMGQSVASQKVIVKQLDISYSAKASGDLSMFSVEVAANTKPITFTVNRTRGKETAPVPDNEAGDFRIEAVSADGKVLQGKTAFESGKFHFTPNDPEAQVGEYTVTIYRQDAALASAKVTVLKYDPQFSAEVFRIGDGNVDYMNLRKNESALAFVIYADGVPCTAEQLTGMVGAMLSLQHDAPKDIIKMGVSLGEYEGKTALIVLPGSTAGNWLTEQLQKLGLAPRLFLGSLKDRTMTVELTVQAEKGTQITGTLELVHDPADLIPYLIFLGILLSLLVLIVIVVICNIRKPRIAAGYIHYYKLQRRDHYYTVEDSHTKKIKFKLCLFNALPQKENLRGELTVKAADPMAGRQWFPTSEPEAVIYVTGTELQRYYSRMSGTAVRNLLLILEQATVGNQLRRHELDPALTVSSLGAGRRPPAEPYTHLQTIESGGILFRKTENTVEIWTYEPKE